MSRDDFRLGAAILAAGRSTRMGDQDKLLLKSRGDISILEQCFATVFKSNIRDYFVLSSSDNYQALLPEGARVFTDARWSEAMSHTVKAALYHAADNGFSHVMMVLADMPALAASDINTLCEAAQRHREAIIQPVHAGQAGNPVVLPLIHADKIAATLKGDAGAGALIRSGKFPVHQIECSAGVVTDIDTPDAYAAYLRG